MARCGLASCCALLRLSAAAPVSADPFSSHSLPTGFLPYYSRLGPHTVLTFIFLEQMNALYRATVSDKAGDEEK